MDKAICTINEGISGSYVANRPKRSFSGPSVNQNQPTKQQATNITPTEQGRANGLIALTGATSILRKISTGNTRLVPALKKIMEAAMDAIITLTV